MASPADNLFYISGDLTSLTADGLYYLVGKIDIGSVSGNISVTFIAEGDVTLSAFSYNLSPVPGGAPDGVEQAVYRD